MTRSGARALLLAGAVFLAGVASASVMVAPPPDAPAPRQPDPPALALQAGGYGLIVDAGGPRVAAVVGGDEVTVFGGP